MNDERSNLPHRLKPCTFGVDLPGTRSGNMASDVCQANAVGQRFVALSVILLYLYSPSIPMDFLDVNYQMVNVGPNLTDVDATKLSSFVAFASAERVKQNSSISSLYS